MKKKKALLSAFISLITTTGIFIGFYSRIESKPNEVGFWLILVLGMSVGVTLVSVFKSIKDTE